MLNAGYRKQISIQEDQIATLDESIAGVEEVTREIPLLMEKMLASIEQYIDLDYPFHMDERASRIQFARDAIDNPDVSIAEKFRQVLVMYQTETSYGRTIETYPETISVDGVDLDVNIARIGRVALLPRHGGIRGQRVRLRRQRVSLRLKHRELRGRLVSLALGRTLGHHGSRRAFIERWRSS